MASDPENQYTVISADGIAKGELRGNTITLTTPMTDIVTLRDDDGQECFRVVVDGRITTPQFNSHGAASAYADGIRAGFRRPEFRDGR